MVQQRVEGWVVMDNKGVLFSNSALQNNNKNSSGDEIANVNILRRYGTYVLQNTKKENLLRLTN